MFELRDGKWGRRRFPILSKLGNHLRPHFPKRKEEIDMRRKVIAGNWKMNMLPNEAIKFIEDFAPLVKNTENEVILCVPYTDLFYALLTAQGTNIKIGAQNMNAEEKGAYTGEVSRRNAKINWSRICNNRAL